MCEAKAGFRNDYHISETHGNGRNECSWRVGTKILLKSMFFTAYNTEPEMQKIL